jgi:IMP cyclohydrolase
MDQKIMAIPKMEYPGRIILIGSNPAGEDVVMYAITGRSPSSQARRLEKEKKIVYVKPTDEQVLQSGNPDLLIYPSIIVGRWKWIAVSNGKQTSDIALQFKKGSAAAAVLANALGSWEFEPDAPNYTPRISGCIAEGAALSIIRRAPDGSAARTYFDVPKIPGRGRLISTYTGMNTDPLPSFIGEPVEVEMPYETPREAVAALYKALAPEKGMDDFRVAVAAVFRDGAGKVKFNMKNRNK